MMARKGDNAATDVATSLRRRSILRLGTLASAATGATALSGLMAGSADAADPTTTFATEASVTTTVAAANASLIDAVSAERLARGEAVRTGTYISTGDAQTWTKYPSGAGNVSFTAQTANTPEIITVANTALGGTYRIGRDMGGLRLGNGRFVSFLLRKNDANLSAINLRASYTAADMDPANVWDMWQNHLDVGRWYRIAFHTGEGFDTGTVTNRFIMHALTIGIVALAGTTTSVSLADIRVHEGSGRGKIAFICDDGQADTYTKLYPMLRAKGWKAAAALEYFNINTAGYCTTAQLKEMYDYGWDMCAHHRVNMTLKTDAEQEVIYRDAKYFLTSNGFVRGSRIWVWPGGLRNAASEAIASRHFKTLRCVNNWVRVGMPHVYEYKQPPSYYWTSAKTFTDIKTQVDKAELSGMSVVFVIHNLVDVIGAQEDVLTTLFQQVLDYIATKNLDVVVPSEIWTL